MRALGRRIGVDVHLHQLRHFSATQLIGGGTDVRTVAGRLGHADAAITLRVCIAICSPNATVTPLQSWAQR